jgi:hypothetical protein
LLIVICLGASAVESQTNIIKRAYDNFVWDNRNHYLPCNKLPAVAEVHARVQRYQDIVQAIERVNPGLVGVEVDTSTCPGKADLVFWYASHQNRLAIEKIINNDTFFGVPYRLQNR